MLDIITNLKGLEKYNDSCVTYFRAFTFECECYGGTFTSKDSSGNTYVLIYKKFVKNPLKI